VAGFEVRTVTLDDGTVTHVRKYKFESRTQALALLGKHLQRSP
jgi:hypothetical protein